MGEREGQGMAFESLASRSAVKKPTACAWANSFGVLYPKLLCGRSSLYSFRHTATLEVCEERFKYHSINLLLPKIDPALMVSCRDVQIEQVLFNLLQNAFDAIVDVPGDRWIRLAVTLDEDSAVFSIIDSGPGVPLELKTKIMEPFFTTKEASKGTGLGLSISQLIVEEHGGELTLTDEAGHPCFSFRIPLAHSEEPVCN